MNTLIHYLKIIGIFLLGCWVISLMLTAAAKVALSMLSVFYWGLLLVGIYTLGGAILRFLLL